MAINERATVEIQVNGEQARQELNQLRQYATNLSAALDKAYQAGDKKQIKALTKELKYVNSEMKTLQKSSVDINSVMNNLSVAGPKELQRTMRVINMELNSGRVQRGSKEWDIYMKSLRQVNSELKKIKEESGRVNKSLFEKIADRADRVYGLYTISTDVYDKVIGYANQRVEAYARMEEAQSQVVKYTGMESDAVKSLNEDFKKMDTRTSREELNRLAGEAGKLSITGKEKVLEFVDAANQINVALGEDLGKDAVKDIGKLAMMFGEDDRLGLRGAMLATGSAINTIGQSSSASEPYLAEFLGQVGSVGKQAKMAQADLLGYASVLDQNKVEASVASTAFQQLVLKMFQEPEKYAKIAGIQVKRFTEMLKTDSNDAMLQFLSGLSRFNDLTESSPVIKSLGLDGQKAAQVLSALSGNIANVRSEQEKANKAYKDASSATQEYNIQNNTAMAGLEKAKKRATDLAVELGQRLYPIMRVSFHLSSALTKVGIALLDFAYEHKTALIAVAGALIWYNGMSKVHNAYLAVSNTLMKVGTTLRIMHAAATANLAGNLTGANKILTTFNASMLKGVAAQKICTAAVYLGSTATALLTGNFKKAAVAAKALWTVVVSNPWIAIATAIAAVSVATYKWVTATTEADKAARDFTSRNISMQRELNKTYEALTATAKGTRQRQDLIKEFNDKYGQYLDNLLSEEATLQDIKRAYNEVSLAMQRKIARQVLSEKTDEIERNALEEKGDRMEKVQKLLAYSLTDKQLASAMPKVTKAVDELVQKGYDAEIVGASVTASLVKSFRQLNNVNIRNNLKKYLEDYAETAIETAKQVQSVKNKLLPFLPEQRQASSTRKANEMPEIVITPAKTVPRHEETDKERKAREKKEREALKARLKDIEAKVNREEAILKGRYAKGELAYRTYCQQINENDVWELDEKLKLYDKDSNEYAQLLTKKQDLLRKGQEQETKFSIGEIEERVKKEEIALQVSYQTRKISQYALNEGLFQLDMQTLKQKQALYQRDSKEWHDYERQIIDLENDDKLRKQIYFQERLSEIRDEYSKKNLDQLMKEELDGIDLLYKEKLLKEEEYLKLQQLIKFKYAGLEVEESNDNAERGLRTARNKATYDSDEEGAGDSFWGSLFGQDKDIHQKTLDNLQDLWKTGALTQKEYLAAMAEENNNYFNNLAEKIQDYYSQINGVVSAYSNFSQASSELEVAKIEKRYDAEIEAAGNNKEKVAKLEKEKDKAIAAEKTKANKRSTTIQIAQALAETAMSAIRAYAAGWEAGFPAGPILAPLFAGMAVAAGMLQVATIRKQAQAQQMGYYSGGFTARGDYRKEVGVVHAGEFVADHRAVNNANILPVLRLIDNAQKNNTIGSLTATDISRTISGTPATTSSPGAAATNDVNNEPLLNLLNYTCNVIEKLDTRLNEPFITVNTVDGDYGIKQAMDKYERTIKIKSR